MDLGQSQNPDQGQSLSDSGGDEDLFPIYQLAVEMADRVSARRATANTFFLSVLTTLVALKGLSDAEAWSLAVPGIVLSLAWLAILTSYRRLSGAKWAVISQIEEGLPVAPFTDEWKLLKPSAGESEEKRWLRGRYKELGLIEQAVPVVFVVVFLVILICP